MKKIIFISLFILLVLIAVTFIVSGIQNGNLQFIEETVLRFHYFGIYFIGLSLGLTVLSPIPTPLLVPIFTQIGFNFTYVVATLIAASLTANIILGVLAVLGINSFLSKNKSYIEKVKNIHSKYPHSPYLISFLWFIFLPNEVMLLSMILLGYRFIYVIGLAFLGDIFYYTVLSNISLFVTNFFISL